MTIKLVQFVMKVSLTKILFVIPVKSITVHHVKEIREYARNVFLDFSWILAVGAKYVLLSTATNAKLMTRKWSVISADGAITGTK